MFRFTLRRKLSTALITMAVLPTVATATAFACWNPPPPEKPHLVIIKKADHTSPVNAGDQIGFTVEVENTGDAAATGVSLNDTLPTGSGSGVTWAIASDPHNAFQLGTSAGNQKLKLKSSTLPAGADYTAHITARTSATECSVYDNSATLTASNASSAGPVSAKETCQKPSLSVTKTADRSPVNAGDAIGFTIKVANAGPGTATSVGLSDPLPSGTASNWVIASQTNSGQCSISSDTLSCSGVSLAAGASFSVHITSTTNLADCATYPNTATASSANAGSPTASATIICRKPSPSIVTAQDPASGAIGDTYNDQATLSGGSNYDGTGSITFTVYPRADCEGNPVDTETVDGITMDGTVETPSGVQIQNAGTYYWVASFSGDSNNNSFTSGCNDEPVVVAPNQPSVVTTQDPASGSVGDTYKDKATLSGTVNQDGTGSITFKLYSAADCGGTVLDTETVNNISADGIYETPKGVQLNNVGTYYWVASFSGDSNNDPFTSGCNDEPVVVNAAEIHMLKTADAAQVSAGDPIGFTMTVWNDGIGDAHGVMLNDVLPTTPGLSWTVDTQGAGWAGGCKIAAGALTCGPVTVPAGTTQAATTFTVRIVSGTTGATGGDCPQTGVIDNTGSVTTTNDGSDQSSASTCVQAMVDLSITKSGSPATQVLGSGNITWTIVVTNNGPSDDTGVTVTDPMPAGNTFVSATSSQGSCTGGLILTCTIGDMAADGTVTITLVTTPSAAGAQTNTVHVVGNRPETNTANNTATATVQVTAPFTPPPVFCVAVSKVTPKQLFVGHKATLKIHLTKNKKAISGIHVRITGPKLNLKTKASNSKGVVKQTVKMKKAGVLVFTPIASKACNTKRVGVTNVFTPPVTG